MNDEKTFCVYKHTSPNGKVYVGITSKKNPAYRWGKDGSGYQENSYFWRAIQKHGWNNFKHEILYEGLTEEDACEKEKELINLYESTNRNKGYNISTGGEGPGSGVKMSEERKQQLRERWTGEGNPNYGKPLSDDVKEKLRQVNLGHRASEETKLLLSSIRKGRKFSEESIRKRVESRKQNYVKENHFRYGTHFPQETIEKIRLSQPNRRPVVQLDLNGSLIGVYDSIAEAARQTGCNSRHISECCRGLLKTTGGFKWQYKDDYEQERGCIVSAGAVLTKQNNYLKL